MSALAESTEGESRDLRDHVLKRMFAQLPPEVGIANGTKRSLLRYFEENGDLVPNRVYPHSPAVLSALLAPEAEWVFVQGKQRVEIEKFEGNKNRYSLGFRERTSKPNARPVTSRLVPDPATQPKIYGVQHLFPLIAKMLRPEDATKEAAIVTLDLGLGVNPRSKPGEEDVMLSLSPALPAYVTLLAERLKELRQVTDRVRGRIFSTGSLNALLGKQKLHDVETVQMEQKKMIDAFLACFYPELDGMVDTAPITEQIPKLTRAQHRSLWRKVMSRVTDIAHTSIVKSGERYGASATQAIRYATYHCAPSTYGDGDGDGGMHISIGGYSEDPFMTIRGFSEPSDQLRVGIVVRSVLSRTPAYLRGPGEGFGAYPEISMKEFLNGTSDRVKALLEDPHSDRAAVSRDLVHLGRCLAGLGNEEKGVQKLQFFYQAGYNPGQ